MAGSRICRSVQAAQIEARSSMMRFHALQVTNEFRLNATSHRKQAL